MTAKGRWSSTRNNWVQVECLNCGIIWDEHQETEWFMCLGRDNEKRYAERSYGSRLKPKPNCFNNTYMCEVIEVQENRFDLRRRDEPTAGFVYIGSFRTKEAAETVVESLKENNPGLPTEFWIQAGGGQETPLWFDKEPEKPRVATKSGGGKKKSNDEPFSE